MTQVEESAEVTRTRRRKFALRSKRGIALLVAVVAALAVAALVLVLIVRGNARSEPDPVAVTVPVALSGLSAPDNTRLGVVLTFGDGATEGAEWSAAAQGAVVAQQRLALGGTNIDFIVENDLGTDSGAVAAVTSLVDQGVSGIVYASSGPHLEGGIAAAIEADVPVILPYASAAADVWGAWSLALGGDATGAALTAALSTFQRPLLIDAGGAVPDGVSVSDKLDFSPSADAALFAEEVARRAGMASSAGGAETGGGEQAPVGSPADVVIVSGPAVSQAAVVYALQGRSVTVPIVLTPQAVSPLFDTTLATLGGSVSSNLRTVGAAWDDSVALTTTGQGRAMSAFLASVRQFAGDETVLNLSEDAPFADAAVAADVRSHDAVVAFAEAISAAGSAEPAAVRSSLGELNLVAGNGIGGPGLDFSHSQALTGTASVLYATSQHLGLRPSTVDRADRLVWITDPIHQ